MRESFKGDGEKSERFNFQNFRLKKKLAYGVFFVEKHAFSLKKLFFICHRYKTVKKNLTYFLGQDDFFLKKVAGMCLFFNRKKREKLGSLGLRCLSSIAKEFGPFESDTGRFVSTALPVHCGKEKNTEMRDMRYLTGRAVGGFVQF